MRGDPRGRHWRLLGSCLGVLLFVVPLGCGPGKGTVTGKVIFKGQPLKGGSVTFVPDKQGSQSVNGQIAEDGTYTVTGVAAGPVKITVETQSAKPGGPPPRAFAGGKSPYPENDPNAASRGSKDRYVAIPDKYQNPDASGLTYTVKAGSQTYDIPLQ
jgi:hypothetical protein